MTGTFCFMTGTNSLALVILTGRSPKIISRLGSMTPKLYYPKVMSKLVGYLKVVVETL